MKCFFLGHRWINVPPYSVNYEIGSETKSVKIPLEYCVRCKKARHSRVVANKEISIEILPKK